MSSSRTIPEKMIECKLNAKISLWQCTRRQETYPRVTSHGEITSMFAPCKNCGYFIMPPQEEWAVHAFKRKAGWIFNRNYSRLREE